jgi:hypothetical protein
MEHVDWYTVMTNALLGLRLGADCWCEVAIGNPMYGGKHTSACLAAREAVRLAASRPPTLTMTGEGDPVEFEWREGK